MNNGISFNKGVLFRGDGVMLGEVKESAFVSADDSSCEKCLSPSELAGKYISSISKALIDANKTIVVLTKRFSVSAIIESGSFYSAVNYISKRGKHRHLFLYSKRKRIRKKHEASAFAEMLMGGNL